MIFLDIFGRYNHLPINVQWLIKIRYFRFSVTKKIIQTFVPFLDQNFSAPSILRYSCTFTIAFACNISLQKVWNNFLLLELEGEIKEKMLLLRRILAQLISLIFLVLIKKLTPWQVFSEERYTDNFKSATCSEVFVIFDKHPLSLTSILYFISQNPFNYLLNEFYLLLVLSKIANPNKIYQSLLH